MLVLDKDAAADGSSARASIEYRAQKPKFARDVASGYSRVVTSLRLPAVALPAASSVVSDGAISAAVVSTAVNAVAHSLSRAAVVTCNGAHFGGDGGVAGVVAAAEDGEDDDDGDDGEVRCLGDSNSSVFGVGRERVRVSE